MAFGRLQPSGQAQPFSEINMTPLVDVMLVLVVILMLTAPLLASSIRLNLPKVAIAQNGPAAASIALVLDRQGQVFVQDRPVDLPVLEQLLHESAMLDPNREVQVRADAAASYASLIAMLATVQRAGLHRIGFAAQPGVRAKP